VTSVAPTAVAPTDVEATASYLEKDFQEAVSRKKEPAMEQARNNGESNIFYSPLVLSIAREERISANELAAIPGTGAENRVTKNDIIAFLNNRQKKTDTPTAAATSLNGSNEIIEMDRMRKIIQKENRR
jgi:2-oxoglutarate dehydrogenase E2 component (dihydrolipoamide succinyltransferase)